MRNLLGQRHQKIGFSRNHLPNPFGEETSKNSKQNIYAFELMPKNLPSLNLVQLLGQSRSKQRQLNIQTEV